MRADREDLTEQRARVDQTRADLAAALEALSDHARKGARTLRGSKRSRPDIDAVRAAVSAMNRAEEAADIAAYDLETAAGADG